MYELFPGNYAWSQAALRAMFVGGSPGEVLRAAERLRHAPPGDAEAWHAAWLPVADGLAARAERQRAAGHGMSAAGSYRRAALALQWAVAFLPWEDARRVEGLRRAVRLFGEFARRSRPPILRREIPFEGTTFPAWLVRPPAAVPAPCAIYLPGWDSTKEQGIGLAAALAERGIATLLCDVPGVGEAVLERGLVNRLDEEAAGAAAFDDLLGEPGLVDGRRIAVVGSSLGGYRAARFAAFEPRLRAAVVWGAVWDFGRTWRQQLERPGSTLPTALDHALRVTGSTTAEEVTAKLDAWRLNGVADRITCPLLVLHGADDTQIPVADAERLYATASSARRTLRIFTAEEGGSAHCQNDDRVLAHEEIGDWLADELPGW